VAGEQRPPIAEVLRADIRRGRFHPRERLVEAELAEQYGVKRSAVRVALLELAAEGLVERLPNRGARVRSVTLDEAMEITETRLRLQAMCAAKAARRGTDEQRQELLADLATLRTAVSENAQSEYVGANTRIFAKIREMGGHSTANRIIEQLHNQNAPRGFPFLLPERRFESLHEFEAIVAAVTTGDEAAAYAATVTHMEHVLAALRQIRDSDGESSAEA
jgi:DNA-binding GntR family transcriptional regulator